MPAISSEHDAHAKREAGRPARSLARRRAAAPVPRRVLRAAGAHHGAGLVSLTRRIRRACTADGRIGTARPERRELYALFHGVRLPAGVREVGVVRDADHALLPAPRVPARDADREESEEIPRPAAANRHPAVLEQLPDP